MSNEPQSLASGPVADRRPASSYLPDEFFDNVSITRQQFDQAFAYVGNGVFQLAQGWTLPFTHAVLTTGDRPEDLETEKRGTAGGLWRDCTGESIRDSPCCVYNCTNPICTPNKHVQAGATAHVYGTFQLPEHDISYMILLPTCSMCNNWQTTRKTETNFPLEGELAHVLYTDTTDGTRVVRVIFVRISEKTNQVKGAHGKGSAPGPGKGGGYHGKGGGKGSGPPPGAPPGARIIGY